MWWKSLLLTFVVSFTGSFAFARAWGWAHNFEQGVYYGLGMACLSLTVHRLYFLNNRQGL